MSSRAIRRCCCHPDRRRQILRGYCRDESGRSRDTTELASEYSDCFCDEHIRLATRDCRTGTRWGLRAIRIGQAKHPGPRRGAPVVQRARTESPSPIRDLSLRTRRHTVRSASIDISEGVVDSTYARYLGRYREFDQWLGTHMHITMSRFVNLPARSINATLKASLQLMVSKRMPPSAGADVLAAMGYFHGHLRGSLKESWKAYDVWKRATASSSHTPLDEELLWALLALCLTTGRLQFALALAVRFYALLRPGELAELQVRHLRVVSGAGHTLRTRCLVVTVMKPKIRYRPAKIQSIVCRQETVVQLAEKLLVSYASLDEFVLPCSAVVWPRTFTALLRALGAHEVGYTPGFLHAGGAVTALLIEQAPLGEIMFRGRWDALKSVHHYMHAGMAVLALTKLNVQSQQLCSELALLTLPLIAELPPPYSVRRAAWT